MWNEIVLFFIWGTLVFCANAIWDIMKSLQQIQEDIHSLATKEEQKE